MGGYVSRCGWKEMRGEGEDGMRGGIHVIRNRVLDPQGRFVPPGTAEPYHYVIFYHGQFTSMSDVNDPEFDLVPAADDLQYLYCERIAPIIIAGKDYDLTNGALYYANLVNIPKGGWFDKHIVAHPETHPITTVIAHTTFFA